MDGRLIKIKDVSDRYYITTRTLRYYEDMGLIQSTRSGDYAYRLYDEAAVKRIETSGFELDEGPGHQTPCNMIYPLNEIKKRTRVSPT